MVKGRSRDPRTIVELKALKAAIGSTQKRKNKGLARAYVLDDRFRGYWQGFADALRSCKDDEDVVFYKVPKNLLPRIEAAMAAILGNR